MKEDDLRFSSLLFGMSIGFILGALLMYFLFYFNVQNILHNNGLMYIKDCVLK
jgi:hypothetical protein